MSQEGPIPLPLFTPEAIATALTGVPTACEENPNPDGAPALRRAGVLVPLLPLADGWRLLLIRRTREVPHHKGQIAFPGGREDPQDVGLLDTALREAREEVGLDPAGVTILGRLPSRVTFGSRFLIHPFVGLVAPVQPLRPDPREVDSTLLVPLAFFLDPTHHVAERMPDRPVIQHRYRYGDHLIWGATAGIIHRFMGLIAARLHPGTARNNEENQ
ncbi:MAG: CoA pyrophosphatase [Magnetococcales bacterium]|nr:CoA pyrophosphatase [Magnetococcales bacterium]